MDTDTNNAPDSVQDDPNRVQDTGPAISSQSGIDEEPQVSGEVQKAYDRVDELTKPAGEEAGGFIQDDPNLVQSTGPGISGGEVAKGSGQSYDPGAGAATADASGTGAASTESTATSSAGSSTPTPAIAERAVEGGGGAGVSQQEVSTLVDQALDSESPEAARSEEVRQAFEQFSALSVDEKLAVFYYLYEAIGESVTPAAPGAADLELAAGFFREFDALPQGDAQLEAMRALVRGDDNALGHEYGNLSENNQLAIWFVIAERMGKDVIGVPEDYRLSDLSQQNLVLVKELDFEQQIQFLRDISARMGHQTIQRAV